MNLRTKIQLFSSLFMLLLIALINSAIYILFYNISVNNELDELVTHTNTIVETLNDNVNIPEKDLLQAFLPTKGTIQVIREDGELLIPTLTKKEAYRKVPKSFSGSESHTIIKNREGIPIIMVNKPIIWKNGEVVTLQVSEHLFTLTETMKNLFYVLLLASLFILIPTIIAGNVLSRFLLQPIKALIQTMKININKQQWKKLDVNHRSKDELSELAQTFNNMIAHLKANFEKQEQFVSNASHELKTPLSIIKSYAQLLNRRGKTHPELFEESVEAIESEADRMEHLIEHMLLLAKNKQETSVEIVDLVQLCITTVHTFQRAYRRNIYLENEHTALRVSGSTDQIRQVIYILVDNALKYSDQDVRIVLNQKSNCAVIQVKDNGPGITVEDQAHIFDRFYRVDKARSRDTGGTGLGLAIAKTIITTHEGELDVSSQLGLGTTFTVKLPLM
ncbi:HAMP domain-containing sensor histidine kinase [Virgibacillus sp. W0430]|uniref:HAMP domain-containing sensor histidine kinase n=1 Tax=Virgibacillus sp. W0430 TaxID=3391580 RepID=UPI003F486FC7